MTRADVEKIVHEVFSIVLKHPVPAGTDVRRESEPVWDSLKHMDLIFTLEEKFEIQFQPEEIPELNSLSRIVDRVEDLRAT